MMVFLAGQPAPFVDVRCINAFGGQLGGEVVVGKVCLERRKGGWQRLEGEDPGADDEQDPFDVNPSPGRR
jgi:hypothetical protein